MASDYDRYSKFRNNNEIEMVPFVEVPMQPTDFYIKYKRGTTRMDLLSQEYYNNPNYGWFILQANPQYSSMEFEIPDNAEIRIPFPLEFAITAYKSGIDKYKKYYK